MPAVSSDSAPFTPAPAPARVISGGKRYLALIAALILRSWCATLRITIDEASLRQLTALNRSCLFILWHNRLFIAATISPRFRPSRPLHCLISSSKDGAWLSAFFESVGLRAVRGSSSRGGREAVSALVQVLQAGHDVGITPDGPRGPLYVCKPGAAVVARRASAPVVLLGIAYESAWRLRSWDRFFLPRPFSRIHLTLQFLSPEDLTQEDLALRLDAGLRALNPDPDTDPASRPAPAA